ncbi:hypothetical protein [Helicobacter sp. 16-1353]|uniref:hypothetical protein n=1 Tax=Helicobacter sp. 16-1353 TaxID=2004996 RepID=UPI0011BFA38D|nr:hypothetical protein [Helicobacter sp. 16-1353]
MIALYSYMFAKNDTNWGFNIITFIAFGIACYFMMKFVGLFAIFGIIICVVGREISRQTSNIASIIFTIIIVFLGGGLWFL